MNQTDKEFILDAYFNQNKSTVWIAKELKTSPKTVRSIILKSGNALRSKKESAELSYKSGRVHPNTGKSLSDETKEKIAKSIIKKWEEISDEEYKKRVEKSRETWYNLDVLVREKISSLARDGIQTSSKEGSKMERWTNEKLIEWGYSPVLHYDKFPYEKLEVDIFLPANKIAIEIDGPSHSLPIYGEDCLRKTNISDQRKNNLLLGLGYVVIRISFTKELSKYHRKDIFSRLEELLNKVTTNFPVEGKRCILLEVK